MSLMERLQEIMSDEIDKETIDLTLDLHTGTQQDITLKQSDHNSRLLKIALTKNLLYPVKLHGSQMKLYVRKSNGEIVCLDAYEVEEDNGIARFSLTRETLSTLPSIECEVVKIGDDGSVLSFPLFTIIVKDSIHDEAYEILELDEIAVPTTTSEEQEV